MKKEYIFIKLLKKELQEKLVVLSRQENLSPQDLFESLFRKLNEKSLDTWQAGSLGLSDTEFISWKGWHFLEKRWFYYFKRNKIYLKCSSLLFCQKQFAGNLHFIHINFPWWIFNVFFFQEEKTIILMESLR